MNDRFKFRVWKKAQNKIVYNVTYLNPLLLDEEIAPDKAKNYVIMQCTGLKDKNGKLIYEYDILKHELSYPKNKYYYDVVIWERKRWQLARPQQCDCTFPQKQCVHCERIPQRKKWFFQNNDTSFKCFYDSEVVGNYYENEDLLNA